FEVVGRLIRNPGSKVLSRREGLGQRAAVGLQVASQVFLLLSQRKLQHTLKKFLMALGQSLMDGLRPIADTELRVFVCSRGQVAQRSDVGKAGKIAGQRLQIAGSQVVNDLTMEAKLFLQLPLRLSGVFRSRNFFTTRE